MAANLIKFVILIAIAGAIATYAVPVFLADQKKQELTERFAPVLKRYDKARFPGAGKTGKLTWPQTLADLDRSELPAVSGGVFVMVPGKRVSRLNNWEDIPPRIHESFFDLDDSLRASSPEDIRTLVHVQETAMTDHYVSMTRNDPSRRLLNQKVVHVHMFDVKEQVYLGSWVLEGQKPPRSFRSDNVPDVAPPPPVASFLEALPRR